MQTITFNAPAWAARTFNGRICHEQLVKLSAGHPYEIVGETQHVSAHSDMVESVRHSSRLLIKSRKNGVLSVSTTDPCGNERPAAR